MHIEALRSYCLEKKMVEECFPFDEVTLVFKVLGKMFALAALDEIPLRVSLKCEPDKAINLREQYPDSIFPAWHMNKSHWNAVIFEGELPEQFLKELVDHSYDRVVAGLPKKLQKTLEN